MPIRPLAHGARVHCQTRGLGIGSLALKTDDADKPLLPTDRVSSLHAFRNITRATTKFHMFECPGQRGTETYRESKGYRPGDRAVLADTPFARSGHERNLLRNLRFPHLLRDLALAGAGHLTRALAVQPSHGPVNWETLLRRRANRRRVLFPRPAQTGNPSKPTDRVRKKQRANSLAIDPWGTVFARLLARSPGVTFANFKHLRRCANPAKNFLPFSGIRPPTVAAL